MRFQLSDQNIIFGKTPDSAVNTPRTLAAQVIGARINPMMPPLPEINRSPDNMIGDGTERAQKLRVGWLIPRQLPLAGRLNTELAASLGMRCLAGVTTVTPVTAGSSYDVVTTMQTKAMGRLPKLSTIGFLLGGYDFIWPSMAVDSFEITFDQANDVNFSAAMINTGYYVRNQDLGIPLVGPSVPEYHLMHPAGTRVTFSNGTTIDYAQDARLLSGACSLGNGIVVKQLPGDPYLEPTNRKSGAYSRDIHRGTRVPAARCKFQMDEDLAEFTMAQTGTDITSLTFLFQGEDAIAATPEFYEFEWEYPLAEIETLQSDPDGDDAAVTMTFYPKTDVVTGGYVIQRVRTENSLLA
jgi:hypothetical protein